jgi:hypothetical protein
MRFIYGPSVRKEVAEEFGEGTPLRRAKLASGLDKPPLLLTVNYKDLIAYWNGVVTALHFSYGLESRVVVKPTSIGLVSSSVSHEQRKTIWLSALICSSSISSVVTMARMSFSSEPDPLPCTILP